MSHPTPALAPALAAATRLRDRLAWEPRTLKEALRGRRNSIGFLRYVFASFVIVSHSYVVALKGPDWLARASDRQLTFGSLGVICFFLLSGFLVTRSFFASGPIRYLWKRSLRIFPGYWAMLLVSILVIAPIAFHNLHGTFSGYLHISRNTPGDYLGFNWDLRVNQYYIGDTFQNTPLVAHHGTSIFNASLWTLYHEYRAYIVLMVVGVFGLLSRAKPVVVAITLLLMAGQIVFMVNPDTAADIFPPFADRNLASLLSVFFIGAVFALYQDRIVLDDRFAAFAALAFVLSVRWGGFRVFGTVALFYLILWLAVRLPFTWWDKPGDFSYGVYLYGYPIQQVGMLYALHEHGFWLFTAASLLAATAFAAASWHLVEKPALKLKDWHPGRDALRLSNWAMERRAARSSGGSAAHRQRGRRAARAAERGAQPEHAALSPPRPPLPESQVPHLSDAEPGSDARPGHGIAPAPVAAPMDGPTVLPEDAPTGSGSVAPGPARTNGHGHHPAAARGHAEDAAGQAADAGPGGPGGPGNDETPAAGQPAASVGH